MNKEKDPLAGLVSADGKATDRQKLYELVSPFIKLDPESKGFSFLGAFSDISNNMSKLEMLLAGAKARALYFEMPDGLQPGEIIALGVMAEGSVKGSLKKLFDTHKIKKDKEGRYFVPAYRILELTKQFNS